MVPRTTFMAALLAVTGMAAAADIENQPTRAVANALSTPPGEYGRKAKTQRN